MITSINAKPARWAPGIESEFTARVLPLCKPGETISAANYAPPRPSRNEYDTGCDTSAFVYTVQPGNHVCIVEWRALP
jgi:hypothetical protein